MTGLRYSDMDLNISTVRKMLSALRKKMARIEGRYFKVLRQYQEQQRIIACYEDYINAASAELQRCAQESAVAD